MAFDTSGNGKTIVNNTVAISNQTGFLFENPINALISNNIFVFNNMDGGNHSEIALISNGIGNNNLIKENLIRINNGIGVNLTMINNSNIQKNKFYGLGMGSSLYLAESDNTTIQDNEFFLSGTALNISSRANNTRFYNNIIYGSISIGIYLGNGVSYSKIHNNTISKSTNEAIYINETSGPETRVGNQIYWNDFFSNNDRVNQTSQAFDFHGDNNFTDNYWQDVWVGSDLDGNGYIDAPYIVSDPTNSTLNDDSKALASPANPEKQFMWVDIDYYQISPMSQLDVLSGTVVIEFPQVYNMWTNFCTYESYYSGDNGASWSSLVLGVKISTINWNTLGIVNGTYWLKVVVIDDVTGTSGEWIDSKVYTISNADHVVTPAQFIEIIEDTGTGYEN